MYGNPNRSPFDATLNNRSGGSSSNINSNGMASQNTYYERQNEEHIDLLSNKVSALKSLTLQIENEVQDQNRFLSGMSQDFGTTQGMLGSTMNRLQRMMKTQSSRYTFFIMLFVVFVFMVIYWLIKRS